MIKSFGDEETRDLFEDGTVPDQGCGWEDVADVAKRKLDMLEAANKWTDLWKPPSNDAKKVEDDWRTIRINDQWRVKFKWTDDGNAELVHITDPHD